jgi:hypothetical protein
LAGNFRVIMASRYDIALNKGPKKIVTISFGASSGEEAEAIFKDLACKLDLKFLFTQPYPVKDVSLGAENSAQITIIPEEKLSKEKEGVSPEAAPLGEDVPRRKKKRPSPSYNSLFA